MQSFNQLKEALLTSVKQTDACSKGYVELLKATTFKDLCNIAKESFEWCVENKILTPELIQAHVKECNQEGIFCNQNVTSGFCIVTTGSEIDAYEHSFVYVIGEGMVNAYNTSYVIAIDQAEVKTYDFTHVKAKGNSIVTASDYSTVIASDNSQVEAFFNSYVIYSGNAEVTQNDEAIIVKDVKPSES